MSWPVADEKDAGATGIGEAEQDSSGALVSRPRRVPKWRLCLTIMLLIALVMVVIVCFSDIFETGPSMIAALVEFGGYNGLVFGVIAGFALLLYLLDVSYWSGSGKILRIICIAGLTAAIILLGMSLISPYPYLPMCLFILLLPAAGLGISSTVLARQTPSGKAWTLGIAYFVASCACLTIWLLWVYGVWGAGNVGNNFWQSNRAEFAADALCNRSDSAGKSIASDGTLVCTAAFLLWISPFILFGVLLFISLFACILGWNLDSNPLHSGRLAIRVLAITAFTCAFGMYSVTSIGGAGMQLANVAMSSFFVLLVGVVIVGAGYARSH